MMAPRRSPRLQAGATQSGDDPLGPVVAPEDRVGKSKPATKARQSTRHDCDTCNCNLTKSSFATRITDKCNHAVSTCKACLKTWISTQLDTTTYDKIVCPVCPQALGNADVKKHATKNVHARFDELERRGIADSTPGWRWCLNPVCGAGQVHQPLTEPSMSVPSTGQKDKGKNKKNSEDDICECDECGTKACVPCDRPYHENESCAEYQERMTKQFDAEEKATLRIIKDVCKKCPKCDKPIQKAGGCDQMICTQCDAIFCFVCLTDYYTIRKTDHAKTCMYAIPGRIDPHAMHDANYGGGWDNGGDGVFF